MTGPGRPQTMQTSQPPFSTSAGRGATIAAVASAPIDVAGTVDRHSLAVLRLSPGVVDPPVEAGLMNTVGSAVILEACAPTTRTAAVAMAPVTGLADRERPSAPATQQQVQQDLRHQALRHRRVLARGGQAASAVRCFPRFTAVSHLPRPGRYPPGRLPSRGVTISRFPTNGHTATPRMMTGRSVGGRYVRFPRF
jgi:hypothetical protein